MRRTLIETARDLNHALAYIGIVYGLLFAYWEHAELAEPGQQYADPVLPVAYCSWLLGWPLYLVCQLIRSIAGRLR